MKPQTRVPTVVLLIALGAGSATGVGAFSLISVDQEVQIGRQAQAQIRQQVPEVRDRLVTAYIQNLGRTIAAHADGPRYPYSFSVANAREINAFALPGGPVWVHRGAILAAQNESQLAAIMAHEVAHIANRHTADRVSQALAANVGLGLLDALLGNGRRAQIAEVGAVVAANAAMAKFSRDDEREADEKGMIYMRRAGFDPGGMAELMQLLRAQQRRDPSSVETFFASHPSPADRIARLNATERSLGTSGRRDSRGFRAAQARASDLGPMASLSGSRGSRARR
ncbi:MAG TPA: M48 family metallopeptidase [Vicinamibacterales bacterium]|nr:M48 family metallopeptidase [Vicinamibacterales bacterium]